jgi:hypothetical protein
MSHLDAQFLRSVILLVSFRGTTMQAAQAALLLIGLRGGDFTAAELPGEVCGGSPHIAGAATGALISIGLLEVVGRVKSPRPNAKGRKLDLLRVPSAKVSTVRTWLALRGYAHTEEAQLSLAV